METFEIVKLILMIFIVYIVFMKIWMNIANKIGEIIGFSRFIEWISNKFKTYFN